SAPPAGGEREQRRAEAGAARGPAGARPSVGELPALLAGAELAAARLVVAALDPVTEPASPARDDRTAEVSVNPDRDTNRPARGRP
ncbi:MAG TPA: hypothetical protein VD813_13535, partial [Pseudonocardia sp.]|nr:hypothetical protein [Pseudonocardia sp.]